ncbi:hypothetical protein L211DRAFT_852279 [Terfezia boudieri ATCC MYA-4762]|uniref:Uncharacterized protein n=1 Tax=Terfezia boudieri ATCC MYA-4762 TaxID=1051890 RepID=A0A3N4LC20_9PEZI|nr:hypothetical protein L211DRAFT_852279 [Terfezia boudieri ATCC MYA-4762]
MTSNNSGSNGNINGSDDIHLEGSQLMPNAWTNNIQRQLARVDEVLSHSSDSDNATANSDSFSENGNTTDVTNRGAAPDQLTESTLHAMNETQNNRTQRFDARQAGRERSPTTDSVVVQPGSPERQVADDGEAAGINDRQTLQEFTLDYSTDARNILHGKDPRA